MGTGCGILSKMPSRVVIINKTKSAVPRIKWRDIAEAVRRTLKRRALEPIQLVFVASGEIQKINKTYRGVDKPTNVLSFPETRDVLIAPAVVKKEAQKYGLSARFWMVKLFIHAILHLEGHTHATNREAEEMEKFEARIMKTLNPKP